MINIIIICKFCKIITLSSTKRSNKTKMVLKFGNQFEINIIAVPNSEFLAVRYMISSDLLSFSSSLTT